MTILTFFCSHRAFDHYLSSFTADYPIGCRDGGGVCRAHGKVCDSYHGSRRTFRKRALHLRSQEKGDTGTYRPIKQYST
jgi:hypothetical protein